MRAVKVTPPNLVTTNERFERASRRIRAMEAGVGSGLRDDVVLGEGGGR